MGCGSSKSAQTTDLQERIPQEPPNPSVRQETPIKTEEEQLESTESIVVLESNNEELEQEEIEQEEDEQEQQEEDDKEIEQYGTYTPFTEFPTLDLLSKAQDDYRDANVKHDRDQDEIPLPFPPPTRKPDVFDLEKSKSADELTLKVPLLAAQLTYKHLADELTRHCTTDIEKVRSFFVWISSQSVRGVVRHIDEVGVYNLVPESPLYLLAAILVTRRAGSYADLLANLCKEVDIPARVVRSELARGVYTEPGSTVEELTSGNTHCLVYVSDAWRIIDQHWGSEGVIASATPDWDLIAGRDGALPNSDEGSLVHRRSEYYFLIDPERYIFHQWCSSEEEQLLARPVKRDEFMQMCFVSRRFFEMGFSFVDPPECVCTTTSGRITVRVGLPPGKGVFFDYSLFKSKFEKEQNEVDGIHLDKYIIGEMTKDCAAFYVKLRRYGAHRLQIWAGFDKWHLDVICEIKINCEIPDFRHKTLPLDEHVMFGLNPKARKYHLEADSSVGGIIYVDSGVAVLRVVCLREKPVAILHELFNTNFDPIKLRNSIRYYFTDTHLVVVALLPSHGDFILVLKADNGLDYDEEIGKYLIKSKRRFCYPTPFPKLTGKYNQTGDLTTSEEVLLQPTSHPDPIITHDGEEELQIAMNILQAGKKFSAQIFYCAQNLRETNTTEHLLLEAGINELKLTIRFCRVGTHKLNILVDQKVVYQYIIRVLQLTNTIQPFPQRLAKWKNTYVIHKPTNRYLACNQVVQFHLDISDVEEVSVQFNGRKFTLASTEVANSWQGEIEIGEETGDLRIFVVTSSNPGISEPILQYMVEDATSMKNLEMEHRTLEYQSKAWREHLEKEEELDIQDEQRRQVEEDKEVKERETEFHRNKERYEREERLLEKREKERKAEERKDGFSSEQVDEDITPDDLKRAKDHEKREAQKRRPLWQRQYEKMKPELTIVRLREAASSKNTNQLRSSIEECRTSKKMEIYENEIYSAEILLKRLELRQALEEAMRTKDVRRIELMIEEIREQGYARRLDREIRHAENRLQVIHLGGSMNRSFLDLNRETMMELHSYKIPPPPVHDVMKAFYLLLGEDEGKTENWKNCVRMCQTQGKSTQNLMYRVAKFNPKQLHPEIEARVSEILHGIRLGEVRKVSKGVATFFIWTKGALEEARKIRRSSQQKSKSSSQDNGYSSDDDNDDDDDDYDNGFIPAKPDRQKQIFSLQRKGQI